MGCGCEGVIVLMLLQAQMQNRRSLVLLVHFVCGWTRTSISKIWLMSSREER